MVANGEPTTLVFHQMEERDLLIFDLMDLPRKELARTRQDLHQNQVQGIEVA